MVPAGARVLDFACGTGRITASIAAHGHPVVGADISGAMLAEAGRRFRVSGIDVPLVIADAEQPPFRRGAAQAATAVRFLHLLPPETRMSILRALREVTDTVIVDYTVRSRMGVLRRRLLRVRGGTMVSSDAELASELHEAGFAERRRVFRLPLFSDCVYLVLKAV
jgi:SAM-dependent methyltransferase